MEPVTMVGLLVLGSGAGIIGSLFGLGGGILFVPILTVVFGLAPTEAVATSLIGIIAGSVGASTVYVDRGQSNVRLGLLLEITTAAGAILGAMVATMLEDRVLLLLMAAIVIYSAVRMIVNPERVVEPSGDADGDMVFEYPGDDGPVRYEVQNVRGGMALCTLAGMASSMTGIGGGAIKVPLMNIYMHIPIKAVSATSSYMIGITAFSGAVTYLLAGQVLPDYAAFVAIGSFIGAFAGVAVSRRLNARHLRRYFSIVLFAMAGMVLLQVGGVI